MVQKFWVEVRLLNSENFSTGCRYEQTQDTDWLKVRKIGQATQTGPETQTGQATQTGKGNLLEKQHKLKRT